MSKHRILFMKDTILDFISASKSQYSNPKKQELVHDILTELKATFINVQALRETKIGLAINKLRKCEAADAKSKQLSKEILKTWKEMITQGKKAAVVDPTPVFPSSKRKIPPKKRRRVDSGLDSLPAPKSMKSSMAGGNKRFRTSDKGSFGVVRNRDAPLPTLQDLCIQRLREEISTIGQWRGQQLSKDVLHKIFHDTPGDKLWKICSLNPQWIADLEPIWKKICEKEVMDSSLKKRTSWFALFESWKKRESEMKKKCELMKQKFDLKRRKETLHVTSKAGVQRFKENGRKRRRKAQPIMQANNFRRVKPILRAGSKVLSLDEWRSNAKFQRVKQTRKRSPQAKPKPKPNLDSFRKSHGGRRF